MKQTLIDLIADGKTKRALEKLRQLNLQDDDLTTQITLLSARFKKNDTQRHLGIMDERDFNIELNRINIAVLAVIDQWEVSDGVTRSHAVANVPTKKWAFIGTGLVALIALLANLATVLDYLGIKPKDGGSDSKPFSVVIYTHGKGGKQYILPLKETKMVADFGGRREVSMVGENNQNIFAEIPATFFNKKIGIGLQGTEGYVLTHPDSTYQLNGEPIYVAVQSSCRFCNITGIIRNQKAFVANAIVSTGRFSDTTDANGLFDITIPPENELSEYPVTVRLNNKIVWDKYITPNPKQPAEILINN